MTESCKLFPSSVGKRKYFCYNYAQFGPRSLIKVCQPYPGPKKFKEILVWRVAKLLAYPWCPHGILYVHQSCRPVFTPDWIHHQACTFHHNCTIYAWDSKQSSPAAAVIRYQNKSRHRLWLNMILLLTFWRRIFFPFKSQHTLYLKCE